MAKSSTMSQNVNAKADNEPKSAVDNLPAKSKGAGRKSKSSQDKRLPMPEIERFIHNHINQRKIAKEFTVWIPEVGEPQILEFMALSNTIKVSSEERMAAVLVRNLSGDYAVTFAEAKATVRRWKWDCGHALAEWPAPVSFQSTPSICFSRLSFDPAPAYSSADFPIILEMLGRMSNAKAFCTMIGACFFRNASRKQAVWLFGESDSGKSFLLNHVIAKICGGKEGTATFSGESLRGAHWKEPLIGKSLLVVNEASSKFISDKNGSFKSLTGDDLHMINPKGLKMFQGRLDCRVFFSSNEAPEIPNDDALKNRLIVCKMTSFKGKKLPPNVLEIAIEKEMPFFVAMCMDEFSRTEGEIHSDTEDLDAAISDYESDLQYVFDCCFEVSEGSKLPVNQFLARLKSGDHLRDGVTIAGLRSFMMNNYQISSRRDGRGKEKTPMYFPNLREKYQVGQVVGQVGQLGI